VTQRRLSAYLDALATGRRPKPFRAEPQDAEIMRAAIDLRAARPGEVAPDDTFMSNLHQSLVEQSNASSASNVRPIRVHRARNALAAVAASLALIGGTFVTTKSLSQSPPTTSAIGLPLNRALRTGTFETPSGQVLGQIVAYKGHPSWIFMNVGVSNVTGPIFCKLQLDDGSVVAAGIIELHQGNGELSKAIPGGITHLRGAQLSTSTGSVLASATFAQSA
jgi:hypothetical protein